MASLDVFNQDAFGVVSLSATVNELPHVPGQVGASGLFEEDGVSTTTIMVENQAGDLSLIEPTPRGGPGESVARDKRAVRSFVVPHYERDDAIMADEVQNVRAFGSETEVETVMGKVEQRAAVHTRAMDATLEHQRVGAVKGIVTTKSGLTLVNLYTEFGISAAADIDFDLDTAGTLVRTKCFDTIAAIEDDLEEAYSHIHAWCGNDFWKLLIEHKSVKETYLNTVQAAELRGNMAGVYRFEFGGIVWERYRTGKKATASNGAAPFIAANEARFAPVGVPGLFITRFAPADYEETVNTRGIPRYAKQWAMANGKGRHLELQSNPISLCTRPKVLRRALAVV